MPLSALSLFILVLAFSFFHQHSLQKESDVTGPFLKDNNSYQPGNSR